MGCSAKVLSLVGLAVINSVTTLFMRVSRTQTPAYFTSTAVVITEICKLVVCFSVIVSTRGLRGAISAVRDCFFVHYVDTLLLGVPSLLYIVNNVFMFKAISHLDAATFQLTYQIKILMAAILSVIFLKKKLSLCQWLSILVLFIGILIVVARGEDKSGSLAALPPAMLSPSLSSSVATLSGSDPPSLHNPDELQGMEHGDLVELVQQWQQWQTVAASAVVAGAGLEGAGVAGGGKAVARRRLLGSSGWCTDGGGLLALDTASWRDCGEAVPAVAGDTRAVRAKRTARLSDVHIGHGPNIVEAEARLRESTVGVVERVDGQGLGLARRRLVEGKAEAISKVKGMQRLAVRGRQGIQAATTALSAQQSAAILRMQKGMSILILYY
jgi:uncharacterized membrane protein